MTQARDREQRLEIQRQKDDYAQEKLHPHLLVLLALICSGIVSDIDYRRRDALALAFFQGHVESLLALTHLLKELQNKQKELDEAGAHQQGQVSLQGRGTMTFRSQDGAHNEWTVRQAR